MDGALPFPIGSARLPVYQPLPEGTGTLFIRQQICDLGDFKTRFFSPSHNLPAKGFLSYEAYRDTNDPKTYLLVFQCSNLRKALEFIQSSDFLVACVGAGLGLPLVWAGVEEGTNPGPNPQTGGLVVGRYEFMEGVPWPGMGVASGSPVRHYRIAGHPGSVIVAQEVPDILTAADFMDSPGVKKALETAGVKRLDQWQGTFLERGIF